MWGKWIWYLVYNSWIETWLVIWTWHVGRKYSSVSLSTLSLNSWINEHGCIRYRTPGRRQYTHARCVNPDGCLFYRAIVFLTQVTFNQTSRLRRLHAVLFDWPSPITTRVSWWPSRFMRHTTSQVRSEEERIRRRSGCCCYPPEKSGRRRRWNRAKTRTSKKSWISEF